MNYNNNYVNYQSPSNNYAGNPNSSNPAYGYQQTAPPQNGYNVPPQRAPVTSQQYGGHPPAAYSNPYPLPQSPRLQQSYSHPMVVIPQRSPSLGGYASSPPLQHQNLNPRYPPQTQLQTQNYQQSHQWQQPQPQPVQYQIYPQYPSHDSPVEQARRVQAMVEIPVPSRQHTAPQPQHKVQRQSSSQSTQSNPAVILQKKPAPTPPTEPPVDFQLLLLSLAEEYINAAHSMGSMVALYRRAEEMDQYYQLIAQGLACMEAVLKKFRLQPRQEAWLTLQYVTIMFEETENYSHMEAVLSKGITLCDRNKLLDLKYSMHHLFIRVLFKTKPKAALKSLDALIPDVEAYKYIPWIYALRFLRVSLALQLTDSNHEAVAALHHLRAISALAESQGDSAVYVTAATLEAMVHLRSSSSDSVEQVQRAIASARSLQLQPSVKDLMQVWVLIDYIDLSCSLIQYDPEQAATKNSALQQFTEDALKSGCFKEDGSFDVPIDGQAGSLTEATNGIFHRSKDGKDRLAFHWLNGQDLYLLSFLLSGTATHLRSTVDHKSEKYIAEGLKMLEDNFDSQKVNEAASQSSSLSTAAYRVQWWSQIQWHLNVFLAFLRCSRSDWTSAWKHLRALKSPQSTPSSDKRSSAEKENSLHRRRWTVYLNGIIEQGTGNTDAALTCFQDHSLAFPEGNSQRGIPDAQFDLCLLAALNSLLIIRSPQHPQHYLAQPLMVKLEPLTLHHPNKSIQSASCLLKAVLEPTSSIIERKRSIQSALDNARRSHNSQLLAVTMNVMASMFFKDIFSEQAQKCTSTARELAKRADYGLWTAVSGGMLAYTLERQGNGAQAQPVREAAEAVVEKLPKGVKDSLLQQEDV